MCTLHQSKQVGKPCMVTMQRCFIKFRVIHANIHLYSYMVLVNQCEHGKQLLMGEKVFKISFYAVNSLFIWLINHVEDNRDRVRQRGEFLQLPTINFGLLNSVLVPTRISIKVWHFHRIKTL